MFQLYAFMNNMLFSSFCEQTFPVMYHLLLTIICETSSTTTDNEWFTRFVTQAEFPAACLSSSLPVLSVSEFFVEKLQIVLARMPIWTENALTDFSSVWYVREHFSRKNSFDNNWPPVQSAHYQTIYCIMRTECGTFSDIILSTIFAQIVAESDIEKNSKIVTEMLNVAESEWTKWAEWTAFTVGPRFGSTPAHKRRHFFFGEEKPGGRCLQGARHVRSDGTRTHGFVLKSPIAGLAFSRFPDGTRSQFRRESFTPTRKPLPPEWRKKITQSRFHNSDVDLNANVAVVRTRSHFNSDRKIKKNENLHPKPTAIYREIHATFLQNNPSRIRKQQISESESRWCSNNE